MAQGQGARDEDSAEPSPAQRAHDNDEEPAHGDEVDAAQHADLSAPIWLEPSAPAWPAQAQGDATVVVNLVITLDAAGAITAVDLVEGEDALDPVFAEAAIAFARRQTFAPATRAGAPTSARVGLRIAFTPPPEVNFPAPQMPEPVAVHTAGSAPEASAPSHDTDDATRAPGSVMTIAAESSGPTEYGAQARVAGHSGRAPPVAAADLRLEVGALHQVPRPDAMHLVTLAPGVVLTNHAGEGHAHSAYLRGFAAGEGQDLEVRVAGIPINEPSNAHGHGYADTGFVIPELVHSVRVAQGPFDPRQGDFAAAGSAEFSLLAPHPGVRAQLGAGSYGRRRLLLAWSPGGDSRATFAAVDLEEGRGFGPHRAHGKVRALGQFAGRGKRLEYRLLAASHALRFDSAGVVRDDAVRADQGRCTEAPGEPLFCVLDPHQGGYASRHLVSARLGARRKQTEWGNQVALMLRETRFRENFTGALLDARGDGVEQHTRTTTLFMRGHYRLQTWVRERPQAFEVGYEGRYDLGDSRSVRLRGDGQTPYLSMFDQRISLTRISVYASTELALLDCLHAQLGARADSFGYSLADRDRPDRDREGARLPQQSIDAWGTNYQPRATLTVGPFRGLSWVNSFGIGSRSSDAAALSEGERAPFTRIWAGESGLVGETHTPELRAEVRAAGFYAHVDRDLVFDETRGRNVPVGATNRYGAYNHVRVRIRQRLDFVSSFTWSEAYAPRDGAPGLANGARVPYVPRFVFRSDAVATHSVRTRKHAVGLGASVGLTWVGPRPLPLDTLSASIFTLDASLRARYRFVEVSLAATNLTDRRNRSEEYFYASDFGTGGPTMRRTRHFSAAAPRQFLMTLAFVFDPNSLSKEEQP